MRACKFYSCGVKRGRTSDVKNWGHLLFSRRSESELTWEWMGKLVRSKPPQPCGHSRWSKSVAIKSMRELNWETVCLIAYESRFSFVNIVLYCVVSMILLILLLPSTDSHTTVFLTVAPNLSFHILVRTKFLTLKTEGKLKTINTSLIFPQTPD